MKKYNVFKVLLIAALAAILVSFIIPQSQLSYTGITKGKINPITFIDSVSNTVTTFSVFIASFIYILSIGILYSVVKKSEKYDAIVNNVAAKFKNKKNIFIIVSVLIFALLTAIIGDVLPIIIFVPAFIDIAKKLGYDSKAAILSTVGAGFIGSASSLYTNFANQILATTVSTNIFVKLISLVASVALLIIFIIFTSKPKDVKLEKVKTKKVLPITIAFYVILGLLILGMVPWKAYFGFEGFANFHQALVDFKVFKISLFNAFVGSSVVAFGEWSIYSLIVLLLIVSVVLAIIYKIKVDGLFESISNGIRKALPYAFILILADAILVGVYNSGFFITIINALGKMKDTVVSSSTISALSAVVYPDYSYASQFTLSTLAAVISKKAIFSLIAVIFQMIYSLVLLISPTSIIMLMALRYEDVRYKDWIKYIYKFFLGMFIIFFIIIIVIGNKFVKPISYVVLAVLIIILALFFILSRGKKEGKKEVKAKNKTKKK